MKLDKAPVDRENPDVDYLADLIHDLDRTLVESIGPSMENWALLSQSDNTEGGGIIFDCGKSHN